MLLASFDWFEHSAKRHSLFAVPPNDPPLMRLRNYIGYISAGYTLFFVRQFEVNNPVLVTNSAEALSVDPLVVTSINVRYALCLWCRLIDHLYIATGSWCRAIRIIPRAAYTQYHRDCSHYYG